MPNTNAGVQTVSRDQWWRRCLCFDTLNQSKQVVLKRFFQRQAPSIAVSYSTSLFQMPSGHQVKLSCCWAITNASSPKLDCSKNLKRNVYSSESLKTCSTFSSHKKRQTSAIRGWRQYKSASEKRSAITAVLVWDLLVFPTMIIESFKAQNATQAKVHLTRLYILFF